MIFEKYKSTERYPNADLKRIEIGTNSLTFKYLEISFRAIAGALLTAGASLTAAPLGFAIKIIQNTFA